MPFFHACSGQVLYGAVIDDDDDLLRMRVCVEEVKEGGDCS